MYRKLIKILSNYIKVTLSDNTITSLQRKLIDVNIFIKIEDLIAIISLTTIFIFIVTTVICILFNVNMLYSMLSFTIPVLVAFYLYYKNERRLESIEVDLPDYLRQLSALIKVGFGLESAFNELSTTINNSLNDEIKRALLETSFGRPFDEAFMDIAYKNNSDNLKHTFQIIVHNRESGGDLSEVLDAMADDLTDTLMLKKERKAGVMMSVMFLLISSIIATPFALGMIRLYSEFIGQIGRENPLATAIPTASMGYVVIQAILVCILLGIVMYSDGKKGIKYIIMVLPLSLLVYYCSQILFKGILGV